MPLTPRKSFCYGRNKGSCWGRYTTFRPNAAKWTADVHFGSKADIRAVHRHVRFTPKADIGSRDPDVRFVPKADSCTAAIDLIAKPCVANCIREHAGAVLSYRLYGLRQPLHVKGRLTSNRRLRLALNEPAQRRQTALFFGRDPV